MKQNLGVILALAFLSFGILYWISLSTDLVPNVCTYFPQHKVKTQPGCGNKNIIIGLMSLRNDLLEFQRSFGSAETRFKIQKQLDIIHNILRDTQVDEREWGTDIKNMSRTNNRSFVRKINPLGEICPEEFKGKRTSYGYPLFRKGFGPVKCKEYKPIETLITLLLQIPSKYNPNETLSNIAHYYPGIKVILMTETALIPTTRDSMKLLNITFENHVISNGNPAAAWNKLVDDVRTPYVLIAPNMTLFNDDVILERLVRMLSYHRNLAVAGGAIRNIDGKWDIGCEQVTFRNWTAWYKGGYYRSFNECVVCDHVKGPFAAKTQLLKSIKFDTNMKAAMFHDLFWRVIRNEEANVVVSCPDVMFNVLKEEKADIELVAFADKHEIHKIVEADGRQRWYGCRRGLSWKSGKKCERTKSIGLSPASMENLADGIKYFMKVCEEIGAVCELLDGTTIGAVKLNGVLPWEIDADISLLLNNFTSFRKLVGQFKKAGYELRPGVEVKRDSNGVYSDGYMAVMSGGWHIEIWGHPESHMAVTRGEAPTKVQFAGEWLSVARNPGLYIRNHYGYEIYRHVEHWRGLGMKTSWAFYDAGFFKQCPRPGHSACLDQYSADGNMQFRDYPGY